MNFRSKKFENENKKRTRVVEQYILDESINFDAKSFGCGHFNILDTAKFSKGLSLIKESLGKYGNTMFSSDNMICWNRNLSFLR